MADLDWYLTYSFFRCEKELSGPTGCSLAGVMIYQIVYTSTATQDFWPEDLFNLVETARRKNAQRSVTGMLLFHEGQFLQLLEGPERETKSVLELVKRDPRHKDVTVLLSEPAAARQFPDWTMGFERLDEAWSLPRAWSTILEDGASFAALRGEPSAARELLLSFRHAERGGV